MTKRRDQTSRDRPDRDKPSFGSLFHRARAQQEREAAPPAAEADAGADPAEPGALAYEAMQFLVDPARVRIWSGNARGYSQLSVENCADLITSIAHEGMQKVAAIVRPVFDDAHYEYEVVAGARRHFAVSYLRAHGMPDLLYLVQVEILDDEAAFMLSDLENRVREGLSDVERARNYAVALDLYYDGHVGRMAQRLSLPRETLVRMIRVADLPDAVLAAFADRSGLTLEPAFALAEALDGPDAPRITATARQIARAQIARLSAGEPPYPAEEVIDQLLGAEDTEEPPLPAIPPRAPEPDYPPEPGPAEPAAVIAGASGRTVMTVPSVTPDLLTFQLHAGSGATRQEVIEAVEAVLAAAVDAGFSLAAPYPSAGPTP